MNDNKLPFGLLKQVTMKFDSVTSDLLEIAEDEDLDEQHKQEFRDMAAAIMSMGTRVLCIVSQEMDEDEFTNEDIEMDTIEEYDNIGNIEDEEL